jgi:hypothetical protein
MSFDGISLIYKAMGAKKISRGRFFRKGLQNLDLPFIFDVSRVSGLSFRNYNLPEKQLSTL